MSVTITRRQIVEIGERTVAMTVANFARHEAVPVETVEDSPEIAAFRQVLQLTDAVARGCNESEGVLCPMMQTAFALGTPIGGYLAINWDQATRDAGLSPARVIYVNSLT